MGLLNGPTIALIADLGYLNGLAFSEGKLNLDRLRLTAFDFGDADFGLPNGLVLRCLQPLR